MGEIGENCIYCENEKSEEDEGHDYPPYSYENWVCNDCWENCPECGCSDWKSITPSSTRKHNKKKCKDCGFEFITKPASM